MSKVAIKGASTGSGTFTIESPATNTDRTLSLPDASGTILTTATAGVPINGPAFSAYQNTAQTFTGGATTKVLFDVEQYDTNSCFASSRFTPTVAGYYLLTFSFYRPSTSGAGEVQVAINRNGIYYSGADQVASNTIIMNMSTLLYLNGSTDYAEAYVYLQTGGTTSPTGVYTLFQGAMIRSAT